MLQFIIDENITPELVDVFEKAGLKALHVNALKSHQKQRIIDDQLRRLSIQKGYILVTKDDDFVRSYVHRKVPEKMVFLHGLDAKQTLIQRVGQIVHQLPELLSTHDFIEINKKEMKFPFSG